VLPAAWPRFLEWIGPENQELASVQRLRARETAVRLYARFQCKFLSQLSAALDREQLPYVALKSSALRWTLYQEDPASRCAYDIDLGVSAPNLVACRALLERLGFEAAQWSNELERFVPGDPLLRLQVERDHYELGFLVRQHQITGLSSEDEAAIRAQMKEHPWLWHQTPEGEIACYLIIDVHHGLSKEISVDLLLANRRTVTVNGQPFSVPAPAWAAFQLIFKIYWEGVHTYQEGAYQYADLCRLVPQLTDSDIAELLQILAQWKLEAAGYFVLRRLGPEFGVDVGPELTRFFQRAGRPSRKLNPIAENDLGDMWPKLWGLR
jgi:hypothetical protein